jgi:hypothetical protein
MADKLSGLGKFLWKVMPPGWGYTPKPSKTAPGLKASAKMSNEQLKARRRLAGKLEDVIGGASRRFVNAGKYLGKGALYHGRRGAAKAWKGIKAGTKAGAHYADVGLTNLGEGILGYLDERRMRYAINRMEKGGYSAEEIAKKIYEGIIGGKYLSEEGQETILKSGLKHRPTALEKMVHPIYTLKKTVNPSYTDKIVNLATDIIQYAEAGLMKEANIPEGVVEEAAKIKDLYALGATIKVFEEYGLMNKSEAKNLYDSVEKKIESGGKEIIKKTKEELKKYGIATSVLLTASFLLLGFSASHMTGFAIASKQISPEYPIAAGFILLIMALCLSLFRKKPKKDKRKIKK